ncbi:MAG: methylmalonyl Co-A mutase-associated GTPase MeaB, partial [Gemmatimonadales bacterium]
GGLATTTREVCDLLDAFGFDRIIVETVGVGQSELAITATADTAALILVPEGGNGIQVLKAGVMEIADLYVVNKADRTGADKLAREVQTMLGLKGGAGFGQPGAGHGPVKAAAASPTAKLDEGWVPPVLLTSAVNGKGITELVDALEAHEGYLKSSGELGQRRRSRLEEHTKEVVHRNVQVALWRSGAGAEILNREIERVVDGTRSPYDVANEIIESLLDGNK